MFALFFVGKVTSVSAKCSVGFFFHLERWSGALMLVRLPLFQFKALICMCEMCCSGVKCSAVPSSTETSTHSPLVSGWGREDGSEEEEQDEKREWQRKDMVTRAYFILISPRKDILCFCSAPVAGIQAVLSFTLWSTFPFPFFPFLRSSFILLSVRHR